MLILKSAVQLALDYHTLTPEQFQKKYDHGMTEEMLIRSLKAALWLEAQK